MPPPEDKQGFRFYQEILGNPKFVLAPMVDASELAWRMLARKYSAQLCFTPMWHAAVFARDEKYRKQALQTCPADRPLIVQFCANDPEIFSKAVKLTVEAIEVDAIDLNLGCPQIIAKRGHFGSFLQDEWELISRLIKVIHENFEVPVTAKMRIFEDIQKTVDYAKMMESAGCQILTVHGRTREQKGALTGLASWNHIKAVVEALKIPVIANGNIQNFSDIDRCIKETGVCGVMAAEGHLTNPALFSGLQPPVWQMCEEYLDLVTHYPCPLSHTRGHLFKLLHHVLQIKENFPIREIIAKGQSLEQFKDAVSQVKQKYLPFHLKEKCWPGASELDVFRLKNEPWICQPYVRPPPEEHLKKLEEIKEKQKQERKRILDHNEINSPQIQDGLSKRKLKKMGRNPNKNFSRARENCALCQTCPNPCSQACDSRLCRQCCKTKCFTEELDCSGHKIWIKTKRQSARSYAAAEEVQEQITKNTEQT